jgi:hypothetical protein
MVRSVVLTPDGEEIAPLREVWEEDEVETHGEDCPCQNCAQQFRGAPPEQHHLDCQCGICEQTTEPQPAVSDQDKIDLSSRPKRSEVEGPAVDLSSRPKRSEVEGPAVPQPSHQSNIQPSAITIPQTPQPSTNSGPDQKFKGCHSERSEESAVRQPSHQTAHPAATSNNTPTSAVVKHTFPPNQSPNPLPAF